MPDHSPIGSCCARPSFGFTAGLDDRERPFFPRAGWQTLARAIRDMVVRIGTAFIARRGGHKPHVRELPPQILRDFGLEAQSRPSRAANAP